MLVVVSAHGSAETLELPASVHDALDDGEQLEGRASEAVDPGHHHGVAASKGLEELSQFLAVDLRAGNLLPIDGRAAGGPQLFELGFEGLPDGGDAGVAEAFWARSSGHIFR